MRAVQILGDKTSPRVVPTSSAAKPTPTGTDLLVRVHAAGITADELLWPELYATASRIPGHDVSGVVAAVGPDYEGPLQPGQPVVALIAADRGEGQAEYAVCGAKDAAPKPASLSHAQAAALPIPALTAWEAVVDHSGSGEYGSAIGQRPGARVLVTGASGAVGSLMVQLLSLSDTADLATGTAQVVALASIRHHAALRQLGASETVDYGAADWEQRVGKVDVVLDTVGGEVLARCWGVVKEDGAIVTVGDAAPAWAFGGGPAAEAAAHPGVRYTHFIVSPNADRLGRVLEMMDSGTLRPLAVRAFSFGEAQQAWAYARQRNRGEKVVMEWK